jgi:hypothetical protein
MRIAAELRLAEALEADLYYALLLQDAGEYSNTRVSLWLQTVALTTGIRF